MPPKNHTNYSRHKQREIERQAALIYGDIESNPNPRPYRAPPNPPPKTPTATEPPFAPRRRRRPQKRYRRSYDDDEPEPEPEREPEPAPEREPERWVRARVYRAPPSAPPPQAQPQTRRRSNRFQRGRAPSPVSTIEELDEEEDEDEDGDEDEDQMDFIPESTPSDSETSESEYDGDEGTPSPRARGRGRRGGTGTGTAKEAERKRREKEQERREKAGRGGRNGNGKGWDEGVQRRVGFGEGGQRRNGFGGQQESLPPIPGLGLLGQRPRTSWGQTQAPAAPFQNPDGFGQQAAWGQPPAPVQTVNAFGQPIRNGPFNGFGTQANLPSAQHIANPTFQSPFGQPQITNLPNPANDVLAAFKLRAQAALQRNGVAQYGDSVQNRIANFRPASVGEDVAMDEPTPPQSNTGQAFGNAGALGQPGNGFGAVHPAFNRAQQAPQVPAISQPVLGQVPLPPLGQTQEPHSAPVSVLDPAPKRNGFFSFTDPKIESTVTAYNPAMWAKVGQQGQPNGNTVAADCAPQAKPFGWLAELGAKAAGSQTSREANGGTNQQVNGTSSSQQQKIGSTPPTGPAQAPQASNAQLFRDLFSNKLADVGRPNNGELGTAAQNPPQQPIPPRSFRKPSLKAAPASKPFSFLDSLGAMRAQQNVSLTGGVNRAIPVPLLRPGYAATLTSQQCLPSQSSSPPFSLFSPQSLPRVPHCTDEAAFTPTLSSASYQTCLDELDCDRPLLSLRCTSMMCREREGFVFGSRALRRGEVEWVRKRFGCQGCGERLQTVRMCEV